MSVSSVSSSRAEIPLSAAQRTALNTLKEVGGAVAATTQSLATSTSGPGQIVNIVT